MAELLAILKDPNYVNANDATKRAIFDKYSAQDPNFTEANAATQQAIRQRFGVAAIAPPSEIPAARQPSMADAYASMTRAAEAQGEAGRRPTFTAGDFIRPALETAGAIGGGVIGAPLGPAGVVGGSALGYAGAKQLERTFDSLTGAAPIPTLPEATVNVLGDVATGATYEMGGQLVAKGLGASVNALSQRYGKQAAETAQAIKAKANQAWKKVTASTDTYDISPILPRLDDIRAKYNYDPATHPKVTDALSRVEQAAKSGRGVTLAELRTLRTLLQDIESAPAVKGHDPVVPQVGSTLPEKGMAGQVKDSVDEIILSQPGQGAKDWATARELESQLFRSRDVKNILTAAKKSSSATSVAIRDKFSQLANSPQIRAYTPEQQTLVRRIAAGEDLPNTLEFLGNIAPKSFGWSRLAALAGLPTAGAQIGGTTGAVAGAALYGAGLSARKLADVMSTRSVNALERAIRGERFPQEFVMPYATTRAGVPVNALYQQYNENALAQ